MNDKLIQDLLENFKNNLPEMQVIAVEERLKEYDTLKKKFEELQQLCKRNQKQLDEYEQTLNQIQAEKDRMTEIVNLYEKKRNRIERT